MLEGRDKQRFVLWGLCCWALYSVLFYNWNISTGERNLCLTHSTLKAVVLSARRRSMNVYEIDEWTHKNEHSYSACVWWVHVFLGVCAHVCVSINAHGSYRLMSVWSSLTFHPIYLFIYLYLFIILFYYLFMIGSLIKHRTLSSLLGHWAPGICLSLPSSTEDYYCPPSCPSWVLSIWPWVLILVTQVSDWLSCLSKPHILSISIPFRRKLLTSFLQQHLLLKLPFNWLSPKVGQVPVCVPCITGHCQPLWTRHPSRPLAWHAKVAPEGTNPSS